MFKQNLSKKSFVFTSFLILNKISLVQIFRCYKFNAQPPTENLINWHCKIKLLLFITYAIDIEGRQH
jgi:hypothetical protein